MDPVELIIKKRDGKKLSNEEIEWIIAQYTNDSLPDYQMAALLMAAFIRGLDANETWAWTKAMLESGIQIDFSDVDGAKVDKHSTGGVGDKISIPLAPIVAAAGVKVPMISGRGLGHTGGTLDKLESIPGFRTDLSVEMFKRNVKDVGVAMIGQTEQLAPADKRIYALRDVTGTVESIPLICASIMSKKLAEGINGLVLDVKVGSGAFMQSIDRARELAKTLVGIGKSAGVKTVALITNMDQPLGWAVGNALEIRESIEILKGKGPEDTTELTVTLAGYMMFVGGVVDSAEEGKQKALKIIENGAGLEKFKDMVRAQNGNPDVGDNPDLLPTARYIKEIKAPTDGIIVKMDTRRIGRAGVLLGAGRMKKEDSIDPAVGFSVLKKIGSKVNKEEPIALIHYNNASRIEDVEREYLKAVEIGSDEVSDNPLIYELID